MVSASQRNFNSDIPGLYQFQCSAFGCLNTISVFQNSELAPQALFDAIETELLRIQYKYSRFEADSIISKINSSSREQSIEVDAETAGLLNYAAQAFRESDGLFDITSGVLSRAWNFKTKTIPNGRVISELLTAVGWEKVIWDGAFIRLPFARMEIDFGGIGKEYACDRVVGMCKEYGITQALINLGGDIAALGNHPNGRPWNIGIRHPRKQDGVLGSLELSDSALATSGDYERYFEFEGARYCHIINPKTGYPASAIQSVSVVHKSCLVAGTLSTIAMLKTSAEAKELLDRHATPYILVPSDAITY